MRYVKIICFFSIYFASCQSSDNEIPEVSVQQSMPVTVATLNIGSMQDFIELNATSAYLQKWIVKSNITGYLQSSLQLNQSISNNQLLFSIKTKEAQSIGNTINKLNPDFHFSGISNIRAFGKGFVSEVNHQIGDFVQEGEQLAVITDSKSFAFVLDIPYELNGKIFTNENIDMLLPDGQKITAVVAGSLPSLDSIAQTKRIILRVNSPNSIPENLVAKVRVIKELHQEANSLPKSAILSDDTQTDFWVMKLLNDSTAVKVSIQKGIETNDLIEILNPVFTPKDRFVVTGNYDLADTAKIKILTPTNLSN